MRLPWVSRLAFDIVTGERDYLRTRLETVEDALIRMERKDRGMPEVPREVKPSLIDHMPESLREYLNAIPTKAIRRETERQMYRERGAGKPWTQIEHEAYAPSPSEVE